MVAEKIVLYCPAAGESEPLHVVSHADIVVEGIVKAGMRGCRGNDCRQMWRKFLRRRPLIKSCIRAAPHGNSAITKWLLRQPFDDVMTIAWFICERLEVVAGISATADIDERKRVAMRRKIGAARVIRIGNVRRQREDHRRLL